MCVATFDEVVDIYRHIEMVRSYERVEKEAKWPRGAGGFSGTPHGGQFQHGRGHLFRLRQLAHFTVAHHMAMVLTIISRVSHHLLHFQCRVLIIPLHSSISKQFFWALGAPVSLEEGLFQVQGYWSHYERLP